jgi:LPS O-antigen subunit length determinant protein (WzzB/FepE family)
MQDNDNNLLDVLRAVYKKRKFIITTCSIVVLGTIVISLFLPDYYKATTSFYAASPSLIDPNRVFATSELGVEYFGSDEEVNQLLSAAESNQLFDYVITNFNLYKFYDIDTTDVKAPFKVRKELAKRYNVVKNPNDGIDVSVEDKDRKRAALMANAIRVKIDEIHSNFLRSSQDLVLNTHKQSLAERRVNLKTVSDSLSRVREKYQIYNAEAQSEFLASYVPKVQAQLVGAKAKLQAYKIQGISDSIRYYKAQTSYLQKQLNSLTKDDGSGTFNLESLNKGMSLTTSLEEEVEQLSKDISEQQELFLRFKNIMGANVSALVGIQPAEVPVVKSRPKRSILVISAAIISFLLCVFGVLLFENYNYISWKSIKEEE